jgi:CDP-4-dehydro-6-deoxyglucose reductase, E1
MNYRYPLTYHTWDRAEEAAVRRVLRRGQLTLGPEVRRFEDAFARRFGVKHALMLTSGSTANLIATGAFFHKKRRPLRPGDEAIVPPIAWATTYYPLHQYGMKLRFVDVELETLNMDVSLLEKALTKKTRLVVGVNVLGNPCALDKIRAFCDRHGLYFLEDNCESMGAELHERPCGTFGDVGTFSGFYSHHLSVGEAGVLVTNDDELYHLAYSLRNHGQANGLPAQTAFYARRRDDFDGGYRFLLPGYNAKPGEIAGAVGVEQLKKFSRNILVRRKNAETFRRLFGNDPRVMIQKENGKSSWFSFTIVLQPAFKITRRTVLAALRRAGIENRMVTGGSFPRHEVIRFFDYSLAVPLKNADVVHDRGFFIGNCPRDLTRELTYFRRIFDSIAA